MAETNEALKEAGLKFQKARSRRVTSSKCWLRMWVLAGMKQPVVKPLEG